MMEDDVKIINELKQRLLEAEKFLGSMFTTVNPLQTEERVAWLVSARRLLDGLGVTPANETGRWHTLTKAELEEARGFCQECGWDLNTHRRHGGRHLDDAGNPVGEPDPKFSAA